MTQQQAPAPRAMAGPDGTDELRREIERTRRELGDTVAALAAKTDVKARARDATDRMKADLSARGRRMVAGARAKAGSQDTTMIIHRGSLALAGAAGVTLAAMAVVRYRNGARPPIPPLNR